MTRNIDNTISTFHPAALSLALVVVRVVLGVGDALAP